MNIEGKWNKNNYKIIRLIGKGNFGQVYLVQDQKENILAIKLSKELLSLTNEYNALIEFRNMRFVPKVYDFDDWEHNGEIWHFIVMDYIHGKDLKEISRNKELDSRNVFKIGLIFLNILKQIDELGYKYTDIKLENIILDKDGYIYLVDYGSLVQKDKPTKEYTQTYNINFWNVKYKYSYEANIIFSITMIMVNLIGQVEFNPVIYSLEQVISKVYKLPLKKEEKIFLVNGLKGKFQTFNKYSDSLNNLLSEEKRDNKLSKIDYILIASIVSFVFIVFIGLRTIFY